MFPFWIITASRGVAKIPGLYVPTNLWGYGMGKWIAATGAGFVVYFAVKAANEREKKIEKGIPGEQVLSKEEINSALKEEPLHPTNKIPHKLVHERYW